MTTELEQLHLATQEIAFDALDGAELGFNSDSDSREVNYDYNLDGYTASELLAAFSRTGNENNVYYHSLKRLTEKGCLYSNQSFDVMSGAISEIYRITKGEA